MLASVGFYGMLPLLVAETSRRVWLRRSVLVGAVAMSAGMVFSRVYLDVHWTVDATAGARPWNPSPASTSRSISS